MIKISKIILFSCIIGLLATTVSTDASANYTKRSGKMEASFKVLNNQATDINGQNGSEIATESDYGWGLTLGYNLNPHILFNFDFSSSTPSYKAKLIDDDTGSSHTINHKMYLYENQFNVVYNLFAKQFTPYIQAGAGWTYVDSRITNGPPGSMCWWDPWWGYVCTGTQSTYNDDRFSYNVALGLRYELDNSFFIRASYKQAFIDMSNSDDASIGSFQIEMGSIF